MAWLLLAYNDLGCRRAGKDLQGMPVSCQANPHTGTNTTNDLAFMVFRCVGVGDPGTIPQGRRMVPVSISTWGSSDRYFIDVQLSAIML
jgi:hypothetical protein